MTPDWYTPSAKPTNPGSWNRYAYAGDDPANNNDPSGLDVTCSFVDGQFICVDNVWGEVPNQTWWPTPTGIPIPDLGTLLTTAQNLSNARAADLANLTDAAKQLSKQAASGKMTDCEALAEFASAAAVKDGNSSWAFENDFQVLTPNSAAVMAVPGVSGQNGVVYLGNNGYPSGFQQQYQDSISPGQDQGHHFAAFLQIGYMYGATLGSWAAVTYEALEGTSNNIGDINLGTKAAQLGAALGNGSITPSQVADWIRQNICSK